MKMITLNFAKRVLVCASLAFTLPVLTVSADTPLQVDTVITIGDTFLRSTKGTTNYGTNAVMEVHNYGTNTDVAESWVKTQEFIGLVKFNIKAYTQPVASASYTAAFTVLKIRGFDVFKMSGDWDPSLVTYDNAPESFRTLPSYNGKFIDADSALTVAANTGEDRYIGRWSMASTVVNSYDNFDITTALNASILNGDTVLTLAFTMANLYDEGTANRYNRMASLETAVTPLTPPCLVITRNDISTKISNVDKINYKVVSSVGQLVIKNLNGNENISVFDMQGRSVAKVQALDSQVSLSLKSGVYLIKVAGQENFTTKAVVF